jgi:hypothetical protein
MRNILQRGKIMKTFGFAALGILVAAVVAAGDGSHPDLSGTWIFSPEQSRLEMTPPTKSVFVIEHRDPQFKVTRTHIFGERSNTVSFEFTTDGKEHYWKEGEWESWTRMTWLGEELVLDMKIAFGGDEGTNVVHYRLADERKTLVAAEWYHMPKEQHHNLWVFDRSP